MKHVNGWDIAEKLGKRKAFVKSFCGTKFLFYIFIYTRFI